MSNKNKYIIDEYDNILYPIKLVVIKNVNVKKLEQRFKIKYEDCDHNYACVYTGIEDKTTKKGVCIVFLNDNLLNSKDKLLKIDTCSHEALHYVSYVMSYIGQSLTESSEESYCYLQGWATKCIYITLLK